MKVYLAASSADIARANHWHQRLIDAGIEVTSTWIENVERVGAANPREATREQRRAWAEKCLDGVERARRLWLLFPSTPSVGAYIEMGYALAWLPVRGNHSHSKRLIISGDTKRSIFTAYGTEYATDEKAFAALVEMARSVA